MDLGGTSGEDLRELEGEREEKEKKRKEIITLNSCE